MSAIVTLSGRAQDSTPSSLGPTLSGRSCRQRSLPDWARSGKRYHRLRTCKHFRTTINYSVRCAIVHSVFGKIRRTIARNNITTYEFLANGDIHVDNEKLRVKCTNSRLTQTHLQFLQCALQQATRCCRQWQPILNNMARYFFATCRSGEVSQMAENQTIQMKIYENI